MAAEDFKFGTQYTVQGLENTKYNGSIGVFVGLTDQDPARVKLALRSGEILSLKPSKLVPTDERPPKVPRQSPISSSSPSLSPSTPATQGMLQSSLGPASPAPDFPATAQPPAPTTPLQSTGVAESPPPAPVKRHFSGSGANSTDGKRAKIEIPNLDGTYVNSSEKLTLEQMADAMGCSWRLLLGEFGKGVPKSIIRPWYREEVQIGWELAPLGVVRAACGMFPREVAPEVERVPLEEVVKNTDPKSVVFPNHWTQWC